MHSSSDRISSAEVRTGRAEPRGPGGATTGNRVRMLTDADETFPVMLEAIAAAADHVHIEIYRIQSDHTGFRFAEALAQSARRGAAVRVLADAVGSMFASTELVRVIVDAGGLFSFYRPPGLRLAPSSWHRRDHRKIVVIDGRIGFVGGSNLCDEHLPPTSGGAPWRDTNLRIEGPAVRELAKVFRRAWLAATREPLDAVRYLPPVPAAGEAEVAVIDNREWRKRHTIRRAYYRAFRDAQRSIHLTQAYFLPDRRMRRALAAAARRGVSVRVLLGGSSDVPAVQHATRHLFGRLLNGGIRVHEWPGRVVHAKTVCVDGRWAVVGSYNIDHRSFRHNLEIVVLVSDEELGAAIDSRFSDDLAQGVEITLAGWRARSLWQRLRSAFWYALAHWF